MKKEEIVIKDFDTVSLDFDVSPHLITGGNI